MNLRTSALLLVVLLTFAVLWYATSSTPPGAGAGAGRQAAEPLFSSSPLAVRVERDGGGFVLRREGGYWSQVSPVWFPLGEEAGREVARALAGAVIEEKRPAGAGPALLAELALDQPAAVVEVVGPEGVTRVSLGDSVAGGRSWALVEESPIADLAGRVVGLPEGLHRFAFTRRDGSWFERRVPLPPLGAVVSMSLQGDGERVAVELERDGGRWLLLDDGAPARPAVIEVMARITAEGLGVREFLSDARASAGLGVYGLGQPTAVWTLTEASGRTTTLTTGRSGGLGDDSVYALVERREGSTTLRSPILRLPPVVAFLREGRAALADPRVFPVEPAEVRVVRLQPPAADAVEVVAEAVDPSARGGVAAADPVIDALLSLTGERRTRPPDRDYGGPEGTGGTIGTAASGDAPPPGHRGGIVIEHGVLGRIETQLIRRRRGWVFRVLTDRERVEYVLDEPSEDVLEAVILPRLEAPAS